MRAVIIIEMNNAIYPVNFVVLRLSLYMRIDQFKSSVITCSYPLILSVEIVWDLPDDQFT